LLADRTGVFVGRDRELALLTAFAAESAGGYLLVEANSGYGKTALLARLIIEFRGLG
jgi:hypothetical protein